MRFLAVSALTPGTTPADLAADMDAEVAHGRRLWAEGFLVQGYLDPSYTTAYFLVEAPSAEAALARLGTYPQVRAGLATYTVVPLVGLPAIAQAVEAAGDPMPSWWPS